MYAVCQVPGRQLKVAAGDTVRVDLMETLKEGDPVVFDKVLLISDGQKTKIGAPFLNARVKGTIVAHGRDKKIVVYHKKRRTDSHKMHGHKQRFTSVRIDAIEA
jgi:large subunit ribosomal protein L21